VAAFLLESELGWEAIVIFVERLVFVEMVG
jgi:hypothetical protein